MARAHRAERRGAKAVNLPALLAFERVARHLNFGRAAAELHVTPTAISKTIKVLEAQLAVRLFNRSTRSVALTEAGARLRETLSPALEQITRSVNEIGATSARPSGSLRINTSYVAYATLIEPHIGNFLARYPEIALEISVENGLSDIVASGFDAGIRLGHALQRDMVAIPVGTAQQLVVAASPQYLEKHGKPKTPSDLLAHDCIRQRIGNKGRFLEWRFQSGAQAGAIEVQGRLIFSEMRGVVSAAVQGQGLAYVFRQFAAQPLKAGQIVMVLEKHSPPGEPFYLYYPSRTQMPGKLRAFVDLIQAANRKAR
jgi:DNA-binding transcriptional LysR family regulator